MPRIRTVKPEFFMHEELARLDRESGLPVRLTYIGLWTAADRRGLFRWRPGFLRAQLFPYDTSIDLPRILDLLVQTKHLIQYTVSGETYGWIPTLPSHQVFNIRERPAQEIPDPPADVSAAYFAAHPRLRSAAQRLPS